MAEASDPPHLVQMIQLKSVGGKRENDQHQGEENLFEKEFEFARLNEQVILWHFNCGLWVHRSVGLNLAFGNYGIARGLVCAFISNERPYLATDSIESPGARSVV